MPEEMDLVSSCKDKLAYFRIKELKDVLSQLGLAKQGKKQDLVERILSVFSEEQVSKMHSWAQKNSIGKEGIEKIIDDTYRKMQAHGASDLASKGHSSSDINNVKLKEEPDYSFEFDMKVRCPCGSSLLTESMIQCEDQRCQVWQHIGCVILPEKSVEGVPPIPPHFFCEICRLNRADPFWVTVAHPLLPVKLIASELPTDGTNPVQNVDKTFQLTRADRDLLQKPECDVQVWCILLNDKVPFRMQWPQFAELQVNGVPVRTTNRPGSQLLGANGRDDGPVITTWTREGVNKITLSGCDARVFCLGVRIGRRRSVRQVLDMIPKEQDGENFEDALARVCRCIGGGNAANDADSDSDLEVVADSVTINLRCPMSGSRMKLAGRFKPCAHMGCFDLETFVALNQRSRKWQCPICLKNYSLENIIIDPYFNRITTMMRDCGEDVNEIDMKPDGSWRVKNESERRDLLQWHFPDGSLCVATDREVKSNVETSKQVKQEGLSEVHCLKLGIKKNHNGIWEVSKPDDMHARLQVKFESQYPQVIPMSSSATGSCRDGDDSSVNQDGGGHFDFSTNNGNEHDSVSLNFDPTCAVADIISSAPLGNQDVIVLSDSDDDNEKLISPGPIYQSAQADAGGISFPAPRSGVLDPYVEDPGLDTSRNSCLGLFNNNGDDFGIPLWPLPSGTQAGPGFQLFGTETNVSDSLVDLQHASVTCPTPVNGYALAPDKATGSATHIPDSFCHTYPDINGSLVDNPLAFGGEDPSLQIFLPSRPSGISVQSDSRDPPDTSNCIRTEDWISLRLGGGSGEGSHGESVVTNGLNSSNHSTSKERGMETLANTASLLLSMNGDTSDGATAKRQRSDSPFSIPRKPRSARPRLYLSIDSDSD